MKRLKYWDRQTAPYLVKLFECSVSMIIVNQLTENKEFKPHTTSFSRLVGAQPKKNRRFSFHLLKFLLKHYIYNHIKLILKIKSVSTNGTFIIIFCLCHNL